MKVELLAPAGDFETLKAAILAGCDACYIGGKFFSARSFAKNFSDEEVVEAIRYAHIYGVKVYVTMNTLVYEKEMEKFEEYALFLYQNNVDAIIIQDIGAMDYLRQKYPNLPLHASTQMHIHNLEGVKLLEELGIERVVLARETPLELIRKIKENTNVELEIFVHGALCISYSGQCLMSALTSSRSGNRGTCAQCCRMAYDLYSDKKVNKEKYLLSTKDLNTLPYLEKLLEIGVSSIKIEGRMKRKEYVYFVTSLYRKAIDSYYEKGKIEISKKDIENLKKIFNRGFTKGFLNQEENDLFTNEVRPNHMGIEIGKVVKMEKGKVHILLSYPLHQNDGIRILGKEDVGFIINKLYDKNKLTSFVDKNNIAILPLKEKVNVGSKVLLTTDYNQIKEIEKTLKNSKKIKIKGSFQRKNDTLSFTVSDFNNEVVVTTKNFEKAKGAGTSKDRIKEQLEKIKDTPFVFSNLEVDVDNIFILISELNRMKKEAICLLIEKRCYQRKVVISTYNTKVRKVDSTPKKIGYIKDLKDVYDFDEVIVDDSSLYDKIDKKCYLRLPRVEEEIVKTNKNVLIGELGSLYYYKRGVSDFSLNVTNSYAVSFLVNHGIDRVCLSYEVNDYQVEDIKRAYQERYRENAPLEIIIDSNPESMILKYDILGKYKIKSGYLMDLKNHKYKIEKKDGLSIIYHYDRVYKEKHEGISYRIHRW